MSSARIILVSVVIAELIFASIPSAAALEKTWLFDFDNDGHQGTVLRSTCDYADKLLYVNLQYDAETTEGYYEVEWRSAGLEFPLGHSLSYRWQTMSLSCDVIGEGLRVSRTGGPDVVDETQGFEAYKWAWVTMATLRDWFFLGIGPKNLLKSALDLAFGSPSLHVEVASSYGYEEDMRGYAEDFSLTTNAPLSFKIPGIGIEGIAAPDKPFHPSAKLVPLEQAVVAVTTMEMQFDDFRILLPVTIHSAIDMLHGLPVPPRLVDVPSSVDLSAPSFDVHGDGFNENTSVYVIVPSEGYLQAQISSYTTDYLHVQVTETLPAGNALLFVLNGREAAAFAMIRFVSPMTSTSTTSSATSTIEPPIGIEVVFTAIFLIAVVVLVARYVARRL